MSWEMNLTRLRMLSEVAAHGSFRAAALSLDYSPSAVSQQIALLEREAGVLLVQRGPRGAQLTDAGSLLVRHADVALHELAKARHALAALSGNGAPRLRVAAFPTATATIVAVAARSLSGSVQVVDAEPSQAAVLLAAGEVDAAVVYEFEPGGPGELIGEDPMLLCLPAGHRLAGQAEIDLVDLAGEQWFGGEGCPSVPALIALSRAAGFTPTFSMLQTGDYAAMQGLVATHGLVGLIPTLALAAAARPDVAIRRLRPAPWARTLRFVVGDALHPAAEPFGHELRVALAQALSP
ncbi:MAG TPA: LysR family transcriptional regulator [Solirubrobacteraceae bacterium]|nr:LysR family transcriptional regulator [Solirubrobacteraceae bacterium]